MNRLSNIDYIKEQIIRKKSTNPYFSTKDTIKGVITDNDHFPYRRFYRGKAESNKPIVMEREAGWRNVYDICNSYTNDICISRTDDVLCDDDNNT